MEFLLNTRCIIYIYSTVSFTRRTQDIIMLQPADSVVGGFSHCVALRSLPTATKRACERLLFFQGVGNCNRPGTTGVLFVQTRFAPREKASARKKNKRIE